MTMETNDYTYSKEEREEMLKKMKAASAVFYALAADTKCHTFLEFTGLMNEYIKICESAHEQGIDFTEASAHSGKALPIKTYEAKYVGEKLCCIYGPSLQTKDNLRVFLHELGIYVKP